MEYRRDEVREMDAAKGSRQAKEHCLVQQGGRPGAAQINSQKLPRVIGVGRHLQSTSEV